MIYLDQDSQSMLESERLRRTLKPQSSNASERRWPNKLNLDITSETEWRQRQHQYDMNMMRLQKKWSKLYKSNIYILNKVSFRLNL